MKYPLPLVAFCLVFASQALALEDRITRQLNALEPEERMEQRCAIEAISRIKKEEKGEYRPDKVIAYTFSDPVVKGNEIHAEGAVFRSRGDWYRLDYECETTAKGLKIMSFDYKIGTKVPREEWDRYYLYN